MFTSAKKRIEYLRSLWGKSIDRYRNFDFISAYHDLLPKDNAGYVDAKTWQDLEFDSIFSELDRNLTGIGQQYLYHIMHKYERDENKLKARYNLVNTLKDDQDLRENIQLKLYALQGESPYFVSHLLLSNSLPRIKYYFIFYLLSFLSVISAVLISTHGIFVFVTIGLLIVNLIVNKVFSRKIYEYFTGFSGLNQLISSAISISSLRNNKDLREIDRLYNNRNMLKSLKKKLGYLVIDKQSLNELAIIVIEYLNMFLLFDLIAYYRSVNTLLNYREEINEVFETVAELDAGISIASYLSGLKLYSAPEFKDEQIISLTNVYHPLLDEPVSNTLKELSRSALITGSNMSGKTTFIKTLGINFILAQTLYFILAEKFSVPKLKVKSSIRRNDDFEEGKSYFFVEIEMLRDFIELSKSGDNYLFLIDEIFRGTNTIERLAASASVLKYLNTNNMVFCTTHDIELQDLLSENFNMYHFSEQIKDDRFYFNYKINKGPCSSGNAIKLLGLMNYPDSIVDEANKLRGMFLSGDIPAD